ncbi:hypothetical protein P7K49_010086 [Saguinus oedipus]|uniref:Anti-Mullerian hormone n=1 Tax=Saguinus oedipus TaxID=9490 RepID=A0ABQ9VMP1_SAGOE|nr:hypothetical protein P7K49_010086 [Saguinus oedipus]
MVTFGLPSAFGEAPTFTLFKDAQLTRRHTIVFLVRLLPETPREAFALWQMTAEDFQPVLGVLLDGDVGPESPPPAGGPRPWEAFGGSPASRPGPWAPRQQGRRRPPWVEGRCPGQGAVDRSLTYFHRDPRAALQEATFNPQEVRLYVDCRKVAERPLGEGPPKQLCRGPLL